MNLKGKRILVTGGTGFIGSHLVEELLGQGAQVVSTTYINDPRSYFFVKKLDQKALVMSLDVCDFDRLNSLITECKIEYIFHLAAQPLVEVAILNPKQTLYTNILGTINILEIARCYPNIKGIVIASSDKAYGKLNKGKYKEDNSLAGEHPYDVSKSATDLISQSYFKNYGLPVAISRFGNVYGEGDLNLSRIVPSIMQAIIQKSTLELRSDGSHVRDYLYVKDVVDGYISLLTNIDQIKGEAFNFGSSDTLTVLELIKIIKKSLNAELEYKIVNNAVNELSYQSLDYTKAVELLGWKPKRTVESTAKDILMYYSSFL